MHYVGSHGPGLYISILLFSTLPIAQDGYMLGLFLLHGGWKRVTHVLGVSI